MAEGKFCTPMPMYKLQTTFDSLAQEVDQPLFVCKTFGCGYIQKCPDFIEKMKLEDLLDGMKNFSKPKKSALIFAESFEVIQKIKMKFK